MGSTMDGLENDRKKFGQWRQNLPEELKDIASLSAIDALGELKKRGHIRSITLVNAPPRTVSTIISKCLAESPSLDLQGLPVFHEVLDDSGMTTHYPKSSDPYLHEYLPTKKLAARGDDYAHFLGSNILIGKLLSESIEKKKGADVVLKVMSHDFCGDELKQLLPHVDNVVSTLRQPALHVRCVQEKVMHEKAYDYDSVYSAQQDMAEPMKKYWKGFTDNVGDIDEWMEKHPKQKLRHVVINGDRFLSEPQDTLKYISKELNAGRTKNDAGYLAYDERMIQNFTKPVYFSYIDGWGKSEIAATEFKPMRRRAMLEGRYDKVDPELHALTDELEVHLGKIMMRHPGVVYQREDRMWAADAVEADIRNKNIPHGSQEHYIAQVHQTLNSGHWTDTLHRRGNDSETPPRGSRK